MANNKPQMRLNKELKKAIHSGDGYDDYMTLKQHYEQQKGIVTHRIKKLEAQINDFVQNGGRAGCKPSGVEITKGGVNYVVEFNDHGDVCRYEVTRKDASKEDVSELHKLFFAMYLLPKYATSLKSIDLSLANMDNDNTLKGMASLRDQIRKDQYLTMGAISGVDIGIESDHDPFNIMGDENV